jgi:colanic acid/amylovoran biosynthesis glycosyltransferase
MKQRVAYLLNQYPKVSHSFIRREIRALERLGVDVQRIAVRGWSETVVDEEDERERARTQYVLKSRTVVLLAATLRRLVISPRGFFAAFQLATRMGWRADRPLPYHWVYFVEACQVIRWLDKSGATHVHAHFGTNAAEVAMLVRVLGGPSYSFTVHGPEEFDKPQFLGLAEKVRRAAFAVAISSYGKSQLFRWLSHGDWHKVKVVHCGLERSFHSTGGPKLGAAPRLVCVGRLCEQKGQLLLLEAAARLAAEGIGFELVLAGDGEMRAELEALVATLNLKSCVRITGWISADQVRAEILDARALVLPSFAEGLPVVIMEALALRRPVIATCVAGIPELVRPGQEGWLIPPGNAEALVDAMRECLAAPPEVLARMGDKGREQVLREHDADTEAGKLAALFLQHVAPCRA